MELRRPDRCAQCDAELAIGTEAYWLKSRRVAVCTACYVAPETSAPPADATLSPESADDSPAGVAGGSAQREYDKRSQRETARKLKAVADDEEWRTTIKAERPVLGRIVTAFTPKPQVGPESQSTAAWKTGADGERRVAEILADVPGIAVLHDRLVPGHRGANIDHIVVGPSGVFVVDAKKYSGRLEVRDVGSMFRLDERLYVAGRDRSKTVDGVLGQVEVVRAALSDEFGDIPVRGVLCFIGCDWGFRMKAKEMRGVRIIWPLALPETVAADGAHTARVAAVAERLRSQLRPARAG